VLGLGTPLAFSLGGEGLSSGRPWVVNRLPGEDYSNVGLLRPVRLSIRDAETYVEPGALLIEVGYAAVHSEAEELFDTLPRTTRRSLFSEGPWNNPTLAVTDAGVVLTKASSNPERSVYVTQIDAGAGYSSAMVSAVVKPTTVSLEPASVSGPLNMSVYPGPLMPLPYSTGEAPPPVNGVVLGLEHGPRNRAAYLWLLQGDDNNKYVQLTGYLRGEDSPVPNLSEQYDWNAFTRYTIFWNEATGYVEVYADQDGVTTRLFIVPITSFSQMPEDYYARSADEGAIAAVYGQEGPSGDSSTWKNVAVTSNVGYPVIGEIRTGDFRTTLAGAHLVRALGSNNLLDADLSPWFLAPQAYFGLPATGESSVSGSFFRLDKTTDGPYAIYRDEPAILRTSDGFFYQISATMGGVTTDETSTGAGVFVYDGQTAFQLTFFDDGNNKTVGLLKRGGSRTSVSDYFTPVVPLDWSEEGVRLVVDIRRNVVEIFASSDLVTPVLSMELDRDLLPAPGDFELDGFTPFVALGHITDGATTRGVFSLASFEFGPVYQSWEAATDGLATAANPPFTSSGAGSQLLVDGTLTFNSDPGEQTSLRRDIMFGPNQGVAIETRHRVTSYRPYSPTNLYFGVEDGVNVFGLTFVDTLIGKFVCLILGNGDDFVYQTGLDGAAAAVSFPLDWTEFHTYRIEVRPYDGLYIFVDGEADPRLSLSRKKYSMLPGSTNAGTVFLLQDGVFGGVSEHSFIRTFLSSGYEVSFKKNRTDAVLRTELFANQAVVVAFAEDNDDPATDATAPGDPTNIADDGGGGAGGGGGGGGGND
jgi:hypothetical protein